MKLKLTVITLLIFVCAAGTLRAQSGRRQTDRGSNGTGGRTPSGTTTSSPAEEEGLNTSDTYEGETVEGDVLRVNTALVTVPVSVMDRSGKYIPDLGREDFHIYEEGVEQRVAYFATVDQPFTVMLVLDTSGSTDYSLDDIQKAAIDFVNQLKPEDRVMVVSFDDSIDVLTKTPTNDREVLVKAIRRTRAGGGTRLYDAVDQIIKKHFRGITGRKAVVLFTDGVDTTSRHASYDSTVRDAEELDALIYSVAYDDRGGAGSLGGVWGSGGPRIPIPGGGGIRIGGPGSSGRGNTSPADYQHGRMYLSELARVTGGRLYNGSSMLGLSQAFAHVAEELRRQYSLGYYPKRGGQAGQRRQIKVRVKHPNLVVRARDSYVYTPKGNEAPPPDKQQFSGRGTQTSAPGQTR
ncbi:MAG TPA: VWA domain-containing protein [Pyrinomonadaceae bacterium]|nr:VWA domain-containing protein [Pyrinomonadaceae bacterium]